MPSYIHKKLKKAFPRRNQLNTSPAMVAAKLHQLKRINASWVKEWIQPVVFE